MNKLIIGLFLPFVCFLLSCMKENKTVVVNKTTVSIDSLKLQSFADTIVCDMVVKNPDKEDAWLDECLGRFNRNGFIDSVFADIYSKKLIAYSYETRKPLSIREVRRLEEASGYSRDIIGKFQFSEAWYYDNKNHSFVKKVHSIIFGYETYDDRGFVKGYKPLFKIKL